MIENTVKKLSERIGASEWGAGDIAQPPVLSSEIGIEYEPLLSCWEALDGRMRLVLSRDGTLIATSKGARPLFAHNETLACRTVLNLVANPSFDGQFQRILETSVGAVETVILTKRSGDGHYIISAIGISATAVAIAIRDAGDEFATVFADLEDAFGLTPSEVQVVERLMRGHGAQSIADDLDVSVHTVRAHLRHCYDKLGVSSREELWQRLAAYRLN
jgi:DNA-binding CsgD family transcriptional regulator